VVSDEEKVRKQRAILKKELFKFFHIFSSTHGAKNDTGFRHIKAFLFGVFSCFLSSKQRALYHSYNS
jgi:hypothetical protein